MVHRDIYEEFSVLHLVNLEHRPFHYGVGIIRDCVGKQGGTAGVLNQRASEDGERERAGYARPEIHRDTALRHRKRE